MASRNPASSGSSSTTIKAVSSASRSRRRVDSNSRRRRRPDRALAHRMRVAAFVVQESIYADSVSRHETREQAIAIEEMLREGLAEPGQFNVRQIDDFGRTVRVFGVPRAASPAK